MSSHNKDNNSNNNSNSKLQLIKNIERKKNGKSSKMDHTTKVSFWCLGIIVIFLLIYFLGSMIDEAEKIDNIGDNSYNVNNSVDNVNVRKIFTLT